MFTHLALNAFAYLLDHGVRNGSARRFTVYRVIEGLVGLPTVIPMYVAYLYDAIPDSGYLGGFSHAGYKPAWAGLAPPIS